jgi:hypothetical protein
MEEYNNTLSTISTLIDQIRGEANSISIGRNSQLGEIKRKLFSTATKIDNCKKKLEQDLEEIESIKPNKDELYEITQLLNSMMGIVTLPYEMHKEYFNDVSEEKKSDINRNLSKHELQQEAQSWEETFELRRYICKLYQEGKWVTTYKSDVKDGYLRENIVFGFLKHMRNAVCHSGDGAINILPLDNGVVIKQVLFYDTHEGQKFALLLTTAELYELVNAIAEFYKNSPIGYIDKSHALKKMESDVSEVLQSEGKKLNVPKEWL